MAQLTIWGGQGKTAVEMANVFLSRRLRAQAEDLLWLDLIAHKSLWSSFIGTLHCLLFDICLAVEIGPLCVLFALWAHASAVWGA